jgi:hypothetical protein
MRWRRARAGDGDLLCRRRKGAGARTPCLLALTGRHDVRIKLVYSTGTSTRRGSDFDTFNVTWQLVMF